MPKKHYPKSKESTGRVRAENIKEYMKRQPAGKQVADPKVKKGPPLKAKDIRKVLKPVRAVKKKVIGADFLMMKPQKTFLAEREYELVEALEASYKADAGYGKSLKERGDSGQKNLRFSDVTNCPRMVHYSFYEPHKARDYTVKGLILFEDGRWHHSNIQRRMEDRGLGGRPEGYLTLPSCGAVGYYDQLINVGIENGWRICDMTEYKSKLPFVCDAIKQEDYDQVQLYHVAARYSERLRDKKIRIRNIRLLYRDRAVQTDEVHFSWMIQPDKPRQRQCLAYMDWLYEKVVLERYLPPQPFEPTSTNCIYCRWKAWCWKDYPEIIVSEAELEPVDVPGREIVESHAKRVFTIMNLEKDLREEKARLAPVVLGYLKEHKKSIFPISEEDGLVVRQGKTTVWDKKKLIKRIGAEEFALVAQISSALVSDLISREFVDAGIFESVKTYKLNKPYLAIASFKKLATKEDKKDEPKPTKKTSAGKASGGKKVRQKTSPAMSARGSQKENKRT